MSQRRYEGPTVVYLGGGAFLTARHVGVGEILIGGEIFVPDFRSRHTLLNEDGSGADAIVFLLPRGSEPPDLPILPIAKHPPRPGEEVLLIGFGRERAKVIQWEDGGRARFGFEWSKKGRKRWGTNRVTSGGGMLHMSGQSTEFFSFVFDEPHAVGGTRHEAQAAVGDSGGAVFVRRDAEWQLAGMMISVSTEDVRPVSTTTYGDTTFAADLSYYRAEILRWARPVCANELDDDGDEKIDFPVDPGCHAAADRDERDSPPMTTEVRTAWAIGLSGLAVLVSVSLVAFGRREGGGG